MFVCFPSPEKTRRHTREACKESPSLFHTTALGRVARTRPRSYQWHAPATLLSFSFYDLRVGGSQKTARGAKEAKSTHRRGWPGDVGMVVSAVGRTFLPTWRKKTRKDGGKGVRKERRGQGATAAAAAASSQNNKGKGERRGATTVYGKKNSKRRRPNQKNDEGQVRREERQSRRSKEITPRAYSPVRGEGADAVGGHQWPGTSVRQQATTGRSERVGGSFFPTPSPHTACAPLFRKNRCRPSLPSPKFVVLPQSPSFLCAWLQPNPHPLATRVPGSKDRRLISAKGERGTWSTCLVGLHCSFFCFCGLVGW